MKKIIFILIIFGAFLLLPKISWAAIYYVDGNLSSNCTSGNYSIANRTCTGTDGNAYLTVASGTAVLLSGDTMYIRSGFYNEYNIWIGANYASMTTISGYGNERPVLINNSINQGTYFFRIYPATNNLTFTKLEFTSSTGRPSAGGGSAKWAMNGWLTDDRGLIVVDNNYFHDMGMFIGGNPKYWIKNNRFEIWGSSTFNDHALYLQGGSSQDTKRTGWNDAVIVENNYFYQTIYGNYPVGGAVHLYFPNAPTGPQYHIFRNNIVNGGVTWMVLVDGNYVKIYNNSAYGIGRGIEIGAGLSQRSFHDIEIKNNAFRNITGLGFGITPIATIENSAGDTTSVEISNNISDKSEIWRNLCNGTCNVANSGNIMSSDVKFLNSIPLSWPDFCLQSSSTAINAGLSLGMENKNAFDPDGASWPLLTSDQNDQGLNWEIGAFVYKETAPDTIPPSPPANVTVS